MANGTLWLYGNVVSMTMICVGEMHFSTVPDINIYAY